MLEQLEQSLLNLKNKLIASIDSFILILPNLLLVILVLMTSTFVVKYIQRYLKKLAIRLIDNQSIANLVTNAGTIIFWMLAIFISLEIMNLDTALKSLLAGAGVAGLAVGLALQEPITNVFSGVMLSVKAFYNIGDLVETNGYMGHIQEISLRTTVLKQITGEKVIIPNKDILHEPLVNYSIVGRRKVVLQCGVGYGDDLDEVEKLTKKVIFEHFEEVPNEDAVEFFYTAFGDSSINFTIRFWLDVNERLGHLQAKSQSIKVIKQNFDKAGFNIPYPMRTLEIDAKGLEPISKQIRKMNTNFEEFSKN